MAWRLRLHNGTELLVRPHPAAATRPRWPRARRGSRPRRVRRRFLAPKPRLTAAELRYLTEVDFVDHSRSSRSAATRRTSWSRVGALGARRRSDPDSAEIAIVVADELQGRGLGHGARARARRRRRAPAASAASRRRCCPRTSPRSACSRHISARGTSRRARTSGVAELAARPRRRRSLRAAPGRLHADAPPARRRRPRSASPIAAEALDALETAGATRSRRPSAAAPITRAGAPTARPARAGRVRGEIAGPRACTAGSTSAATARRRRGPGAGGARVVEQRGRRVALRRAAPRARA